MKWVILLLSIACNATASVMVKFAVTPPRGLPRLAEPAALLTNWPFWVGVVLYGGAFLLYALALERFPLNVAHPILTAGAIATVTCLSLIIFHEPLPWTTGVGLVLVVAGVVLIASHQV